MSESLTERVHATLTAEDDGRVCKDIPDEACDEQPENFTLHIASLSCTKAGDGLADPKLVLAWLLESLGASAGLIGLLVPVRESGALLPQLVTAGWIRSLPRRKWAWATGSAVQGLCVAGMAIAAFTLEGNLAGGVIVGLLAVFAIARSVCSVSYKDVLGKTVSKSTRGTATGTAASVSAGVVLAFGLAITLGLIPLTVTSIAITLCVAAGLWLTAAGLFSGLTEAAGSTEGGGNPLAVAIDQFSLLKTDPQLTRFIATRGLLIPTALAPPYLLTSSAQANGSEESIANLGPFVIASSVAALTSSYIWGRLSDRSSRKVLMLAGIIGGLTLLASAAIGWLGVVAQNGSSWVFAGLLFVLMVAYRGVRVGRSTHIVDMAAPDTRAAYTALSNTIVGLLLLVAGGFAAIAEWAGNEVVLALFGMMSFGATLVALGLNEVQQRDQAS